MHSLMRNLNHLLGSGKIFIKTKISYSNIEFVLSDLNVL